MEKNQSSFPVICFGESFWTPDLQIPATAGSPVNLSFYLKKLGITPLLLTRVGLDDEGKWLIRFLEESGINTDHFQLDYELTTGKAYSNNDSKNTRPDAWTNIHWEQSYEALLNNAVFIAHTSRPACSPSSSNTLNAIITSNRKRIVNLNLATPFFNKIIVERCLTNSFVLQLTEGELNFITGWFAKQEDLKERVEVLRLRFKISHIIIAKQDGTVLLNTDGAFYEAGTSNTAFNGDAFLAAFIFHLLKDQSAASGLKSAYTFQLNWPVEIASTYKNGDTIFNNI